jgi:hypothetical protein
MGIAERRLPERNAIIKLIRDSVAAVFCRDFTIEDIAVHTQISQEIIYHYFKSKDDPYYNLIQSAQEKISDSLTKITDSVRDGPELKIKN